MTRVAVAALVLWVCEEYVWLRRDVRLRGLCRRWRCIEDACVTRGDAAWARGDATETVRWLRLADQARRQAGVELGLLRDGRGLIPPGSWWAP